MGGLGNPKVTKKLSRGFDSGMLLGLWYFLFHGIEKSYGDTGSTVKLWPPVQAFGLFQKTV